MESLDKLKVEHDSEYTTQFDKDEIVMFSEKANKVNRHGYKQERIVILTSTHFYNFKKKKLSRKTHILLIKAAIMNKNDDQDIVLHIPSQFDQRYVLKDRNEFLHTLQLRYANLDKKSTFRIYVVKDDLKAYTATLKDRRYGIVKLPSKDWRRVDKEIAGLEELKSKRDDDEYDSEEEGKDEVGELDDNKLNKNKSSSKTGDLKLENSRQSIKDLSEDLLSSVNAYDSNDLVGRESIMIFSAVKPPKPLTLDDFEIIDFLGQGTFGKVYLTRLKSNMKLYAIKAIDKQILIEYDQEENTKLEEEILLKCKHPFLLGMDYVFQNIENIYFVMPYVKGGELYTHLTKSKRFPEEVVRFYATQIILGLGYLHNEGIVHRDLKLENILIDEDGYIKIIDFGLAKILKNEEETMTYCGTPEYLAPEVISHKGHHKSVDWWAVGILIYEMMIGVTPFYNKNRNMMLSKIQFAKIVFPDKTKYKIDYSDEVQDLICRLLVKDKDERLGTEGDMDEILKHDWFKDVDVEGILNKTVEPPFVPKLQNAYDTKYFKKE